MTTASCPITRCPLVIHKKIWEFLDERSLSCAERVCMAWRNTIRWDPPIWRTCCQINNIPIIFPKLSLKEGIKGLFASDNERILELIFEYAHDWKPEVLEGKVALFYSTQANYAYISVPYKTGHCPELPWGKRDVEPFVDVRVYNDESLERKQKIAEEEDTVKAAAMGGDWHTNYPRIPTGRFPRRVPLRLFHNHQGLLMSDGDTIQLLYLKIPIRLTLTSDSTVMPFAAALASRISCALHTDHYFITQYLTDAAQSTAKTERRTWNPSE